MLDMFCYNITKVYPSHRIKTTPARVGEGTTLNILRSLLFAHQQRGQEKRQHQRHHHARKCKDKIGADISRQTEDARQNVAVKPHAEERDKRGGQ
ncbi:hypothetical protein D3C78_1690740 [compost metagenome]